MLHLVAMRGLSLEALGWGHLEEAFYQLAWSARLGGQFHLALRARTRHCFKTVLWQNAIHCISAPLEWGRQGGWVGVAGKRNLLLVNAEKHSVTGIKTCPFLIWTVNIVWIAWAQSSTALLTSSNLQRGPKQQLFSRNIFLDPPHPFHLWPFRPPTRHRINCGATCAQHPFLLDPLPFLSQGPVSPHGFGDRKPITRALERGCGGRTGGTLLPSASGTREWGEQPGSPCVPQRSCTESRWAPRSSGSRCWCAPLHAPRTWAGQTSFLVWEEVAEKALSSHWGRAEMGHQHCKPQLAPG